MPTLACRRIDTDKMTYMTDSGQDLDTRHVRSDPPNRHIINNNSQTTHVYYINVICFMTYFSFEGRESVLLDTR